MYTKKASASYVLGSAFLSGMVLPSVGGFTAPPEGIHSQMSKLLTEVEAMPLKSGPAWALRIVLVHVQKLAEPQLVAPRRA